MRDLEPTPDVLNLQAPFRMGKEALPTGRNINQRETHRKHPRNSSSDSSLLEPLPNDRTRKRQQRYSNLDGYEPEGGSDSFESIVEEPPVSERTRGDASSEHQAQPRIYERQPRRKTRPDLYDVKVPKGKENKRPGNESKQSRAGKQKCKRGSSGLPKLSSEYVLTERLTVESP